MILQTRVTIEGSDNYDSLYERLSEAAGPFLMGTLEAIEKGESEPIGQDDSLACPAPKLTAGDGLISFDRPARQVHDQVRGMTSRPGAYAFFRGQLVKIRQTVMANDMDSANDPAGTVLASKKRLLVACRNSVIELTRLLPQGRKEMDGISFINGFRPREGDKFGEDQN